MADTLNFGWTKPTVGGSSGSWGTELNQALDDIDADLEVVDDQIDAADAREVAFPLIFAYLLPFNAVKHAISGNLLNLGAAIAGGTEDDIDYAIDVRPGQRITGFKSYAREASAATAITVSLCYYDNTGALTVVSAGHGHSTSLAVVQTVSVDHDVVSDRCYFIRVHYDRDSGSLGSELYWVQPRVSLTP
jgi:hypothetical protein